MLPLLQPCDATSTADNLCHHYTLLLSTSDLFYLILFTTSTATAATAVIALIDYYCLPLWQQGTTTAVITFSALYHCLSHLCA